MRAATCLAAVGILVSAASCGTAQPASEGAGPTATNPVSSNSGPWGVEIVEPPRSAGEPSLVEQLAVFHDKRTARDVLESCCPSDESDTVEGRELYGQSRLLAAPNSSLFGVPTENGWVCPHFVDPEGEEEDSGPCWSTLRDGVSFSLEGDSHFYRLYGVAANDVESVTVVAAGKQIAADMGRNTFIFSAKPVAVCPTKLDRLVVTHKGGKTTAVELAKVSSLRTASPSVFGCG